MPSINIVCTSTNDFGITPKGSAWVMRQSNCNQRCNEQGELTQVIDELVEFDEKLVKIQEFKKIANPLKRNI